MSKIDFTQVLHALDGDELETKKFGALDAKTGKKEESIIPLTLALACGEALLSTLPQDIHEEGPKKYERWQIAGKFIKATEPVELEAEEIALIKNRIGVQFGPVVVGPVYHLLEQKEDTNGK